MALQFLLLDATEVVHHRRTQGIHQHGIGPQRGQRVAQVVGDALAALGFTMITSITQAAVRLGLIGQSAATRLAAHSSEHLDSVVAAVIARHGRRTFGAFTPGLEVATLLQPTLNFRMFAS